MRNSRAIRKTTENYHFEWENPIGDSVNYGAAAAGCCWETMMPCCCVYPEGIRCCWKLMDSVTLQSCIYICLFFWILLAKLLLFELFGTLIHIQKRFTEIARTPFLGWYTWKWQRLERWTLRLVKAFYSINSNHRGLKGDRRFLKDLPFRKEAVHYPQCITRIVQAAGCLFYNQDSSSIAQDVVVNQ